MGRKVKRHTRGLLEDRKCAMKDLQKLGGIDKDVDARDVPIGSFLIMQGRMAIDPTEKKKVYIDDPTPWIGQLVGVQINIKETEKQSMKVHWMAPVEPEEHQGTWNHMCHTGTNTPFVTKISDSGMAQIFHSNYAWKSINGPTHTMGKQEWAVILKNLRTHQVVRNTDTDTKARNSINRAKRKANKITPHYDKTLGIKQSMHNHYSASVETTQSGTNELLNKANQSTQRDQIDDNLRRSSRDRYMAHTTHALPWNGSSLIHAWKELKMNVPMEVAKSIADLGKKIRANTHQQPNMMHVLNMGGGIALDATIWALAITSVPNKTNICH